MMYKQWLAIALILIVVGGAVFTFAATRAGGISSLSTVKYTTTKHEVNDAFSSVSINTDTADITLAPSADGSCIVECRERSKVRYAVEVKDGVLCIETVDTRKWYEHMAINFEGPGITVYLPMNEYEALFIESHTGRCVISNGFKFGEIDVRQTTGDIECGASATGTIKLETSTGDISLNGASASTAELKATTGDIEVNDTTCDGNITAKVTTGKSKFTNIACYDFNSSGSTGSAELTNVRANGKMTVERSTGSIRLDGSDAGDIFIRTDTGSVKGTLLSAKVFDAESDTGNVAVPNTKSGGACYIRTDTGSISISIIQ